MVSTAVLTDNTISSKNTVFKSGFEIKEFNPPDLKIHAIELPISIFDKFALQELGSNTKPGGNKVFQMQENGFSYSGSTSL